MLRSSQGRVNEKTTQDTVRGLAHSPFSEDEMSTQGGVRSIPYESNKGNTRRASIVNGNQETRGIQHGHSLEEASSERREVEPMCSVVMAEVVS
jgi:hypothetical protein